MAARRSASFVDLVDLRRARDAGATAITSAICALSCVELAVPPTRQSTHHGLATWASPAPNRDLDQPMAGCSTGDILSYEPVLRQRVDSAGRAWARQAVEHPGEEPVERLGLVV